MKATTNKLKHFLFVDFETYYDKEYSLRKLTPPEYILDPRYETILLAVYDIRWDAPRIIDASEIPEFLRWYPAAETACCSHNALFDMAILAWRYGWVPGRLQDTLGMVRALRNYQRNSLKEVIKQLFSRDSKGDTIHKVIGMRAQDIKRAGLWPSYCEYAMNDVRECSHIYMKLAPEFPQEERRLMDLVLRAAVEPVLWVDTPLLEKHLHDLRKRKEGLLRDCGYEKAALMSTRQFQLALEDLGVAIRTKSNAKGKPIPAFAKTDPFMAELQEYDEGDEDTNYAVQTLAAARLSQKSTIEETRVEKFLNIARLPWINGTCNYPNCDGLSVGHCHKDCHAPLLPVALRYGGAHTHRLSGEWKLNMQNLPRDKIKSRLRAAVIAPPGYKLITADLSQIEARLVARTCGQDDLVDMFRAGEDVYASFASVVFDREINKKDNPNERFLGKTAILGLGYGCGAERFNQMVRIQARQYGIPLEGLFDEDIAQRIVDLYRTRFPRIQRTWWLLDKRLEHIIYGHSTAKTSWGPVVFKSATVVLPNHMTLRYTIGDQNMYGAKLLENITQALARIVLMQAAERLAQRGLRFALQCHDELVLAVPDDDVNVAKNTIYEEMVREPAWLDKLPLAVEIGVGQSYGDAK